MHTITIYGRKGGTGRTILTMALAAALVAKCRRVAIADATLDPMCPVSICHAPWVARQHAEGTPETSLAVFPVGPEDSLADALARARQRGAEIALIDTQASVTPHHYVAAEVTDLVLVPFIGRMEAETVGAHLGEAGERVPIFGVDVGVEGGAVRRRHVAALYGGPMLHSTLPRSELFMRMPAEGRLDRFVAALETPADTPDAPSFAATEAMRRAWVAAQELATEVVWILEGQTLEPARVDWAPGATDAACARPFLI